MKWGDVQLLTDVDAAEYLEFSERQTKTRTGAESRNVRAIKTKAYSFANGSPDRDPVFAGSQNFIGLPILDLLLSLFSN